jgi:hypothetical protein
VYVQAVTLFLFYAGFSYAAYLGLLRRFIVSLFGLGPHGSTVSFRIQEPQHFCIIVLAGLDIVSVL